MKYVMKKNTALDVRLATDALGRRRRCCCSSSGTCSTSRSARSTSPAARPTTRTTCSSTRSTIWWLTLIYLRRDGVLGAAPAPRHLERRADPRLHQQRAGRAHAPSGSGSIARRGHRRRLLARADLRPRRRHRPSRGCTHDRHARHHAHRDPSTTRPRSETDDAAGYYTPGDPIADTKAPGGPIDERWDTRKFEARIVNPANRRKLSVIVVGTGLAGALRRRDARRGRLRREVVLLPGLPAPRALDRRPGRHQRGQELQGATATPSTGSSTTPSRAATTARASRTSTGWPRSARTSSTSASRRACPFAREYGGLLDNRSFGGVQVSRTFYARGQTGQQLLIGAYQALERQVAAGTVRDATPGTRCSS